MKGLILTKNGGKEAQGKEYVSERLQRLFFVPEGSILGHPDWGSQIPSLLHEPLDETSADDLINEMDFLFSSREDYVELDSAEVSIVELGAGKDGIVMNLGVILPQEEEIVDLEFFSILEV